MNGDEVKFDDMFKEERKQAEALGWTEINVVYDDMYGGCYLGGIAPEDGKWKEFKVGDVSTEGNKNE